MEKTMRKKPVNAPKPTNAIRPRNAIATREAILRAALIAFSRAGYDGAGVREIAQDAGVTAMLVNRYFGSKEALFTAAVQVIFRQASLLKRDAAPLSRPAPRALPQDTPPPQMP